MTVLTSTIKIILIITTVLAVATLAIVPPITQDVAFHQFVDRRFWLSIPNYWNVLTNLGVLWVGFLGLYQLLKAKRLNILTSLTINYAFFLLGLL